VSLYEITDYELEVLEQGSPSSAYLNFAIFFGSVGLSFLATLLTVDVSSLYVFTVFIVLTVAGFAGALVLFELWRRTRSKTVELCKKIRARIATAPVVDMGKDTPRPEDGPTEATT
jgi:hypothetical protein